MFFANQTYNIDDFQTKPTMFAKNIYKNKKNLKKKILKEIYAHKNWNGRKMV